MKGARPADRSNGMAKGYIGMKDTFAKIEVMLLQKSRRKWITNIALILLLVILAFIAYWSLTH
jgi:hypothetical protein